MYTSNPTFPVEFSMKLRNCWEEFQKHMLNFLHVKDSEGRQGVFHVAVFKSIFLQNHYIYNHEIWTVDAETLP